MRIKPTKPGLSLRDPRTRKLLPDEGMNVTDSAFWRRRIKDGDVSIVDEAEAEPPAPEVTPVAPLATRGPGNL